jgi:hypothetical protein
MTKTPTITKEMIRLYHIADVWRSLQSIRVDGTWKNRAEIENTRNRERLKEYRFKRSILGQFVDLNC